MAVVRRAVGSTNKHTPGKPNAAAAVSRFRALKTAPGLCFAADLRVDPGACGEGGRQVEERHFLSSINVKSAHGVAAITRDHRAFLFNGSAAPEQQWHQQPIQSNRSCRRNVRGSYRCTPSLAGLVPVAQAVFLRRYAFCYLWPDNTTFAVTLRSLAQHAPPQAKAASSVPSRLYRAPCRVTSGCLVRH